MKIGNEAIIIARHISDFLNTYAPFHKASSMHLESISDLASPVYLLP